ncbi:MAG: BMP family ABC transporter substrate-binding protein [Actinobacteria bacterium]|nr:BMP family ABC transporter substrate-binding protein [Actinomycetota bacterium]
MRRTQFLYEEADRSVNGKISRVLVVLLALTLILAFVPACSPKEDTTEEETTEETTEPPLKAAMVTDVGGLGDKSFNDLSYEGLKRAEEELGVEIEVLESKEITDYESNIDQLASAGFSPIFAVGFLMTDTVVKLAPEYPDTQFGGVDEFFDPTIENVVGLNFKEEEGSYLAGVVAGMATKETFDAKLNDKNIIGFVGGMDVPLIKKFEAGFIAGAKSVNPDVQVISLYTGSFTDQAKGKELGLSLIDQGADVIYAAAGACGTGTVQACQEKGALFIGVDADQYLTIEGTGDVMLTSMMKRVDNAVFQTIEAAVNGDLKTGENQVFGLKEGGVELAPFHDFDSKVPQAIKDAVEKATADIIDGKITVPTTL